MPVQVFTEDVQNEMLFNDGEGIRFEDQNDHQRLVRRALQDHVLGRRFFLPGHVINQDLRTLVDALMITGNGADMDITVHPGLSIFRLTADPGQPDYRYLLHEKQGTQVITVDAADGTNPRWDILSIKVEHEVGDSETRHFKDASTGALSSQSMDKRRRTKQTITYTPGTPNASPSEPAVPSGEVKIARIIVAAGVTTLDDDDIYDFRRPWGYGRHVIPLNAGLRGAWTYTATAPERWAASGAAQVLDIPMQIPYHSGLAGVIKHVRLSRLYTTALLAVGGTGAFFMKDAGQYTDVRTTERDITSDFTLGSSGRYLSNLTTGDPIWLNGRENPNNLDGSLVDPIGQLQLTAGGATDQLRGIVLEYYGL